MVNYNKCLQISDMTFYKILKSLLGVLTAAHLGQLNSKIGFRGIAKKR